MKRFYAAVAAAAVMTILLGGGAAAQRTSAPYTIQGSLRSGGVPATGAYDIRYAYYNAPVGGTLLGSGSRPAVAVLNGLFSFAALADTEFLFPPGADVWIEFGVRPAGTQDPYVTLAPRQLLTYAPYALSALDSLRVGGLPASEFARAGDPRLDNARPPLPGSGDYVQIRPYGSGQGPGNFWIQGVGKADAFEAAEFRAPGGGRIFASSTAFPQNVVAGYTAGFAVTSGSRNAFFGYAAGYRVTSGSGNTIAGAVAGYNLTAGSNNSYYGSQVAELSGGGDFNSFFGHRAGERNNGSLNSFFGTGAGLNTDAGASNSFFGHDAGNANITGSFNSVFGENADVGAVGLTNATALGSKAFVSASNALVLGSIAGVNGAAASANVGIGTSAPNFRLHVRADGQNGIKLQHTGAGTFPQIRWTDANDAFRASIGVDTGGTGNMNFFVGGADRLVIRSTGLVQASQGVYIPNPATVIITSPNGACWGITVNNSGQLSTFPVTPCP